ncbi:unnamed protein product [Lupinus luteus]|uniref:Uncharacterized protein n=1 Tax=Lupinus luteus TaxID=3873 RepID=A0AAV1W7A1_LUPLU
MGEAESSRPANPNKKKGFRGGHERLPSFNIPYGIDQLLLNSPSKEAYDRVSLSAILHNMNASAIFIASISKYLEGDGTLASRVESDALVTLQTQHSPDMQKMVELHAAEKEELVNQSWGRKKQKCLSKSMPWGRRRQSFRLRRLPLRRRRLI